MPVYIGHPDVPEVKGDWPDKRAYGWLCGITAENEGMCLAGKWSLEGREMVAHGHFRFYSPYWAMEKMSDGLHPCRLISVGLTNQPNIPVPALANASEGDRTDLSDPTNLPENGEHATPSIRPTQCKQALDQLACGTGTL